MTNATAEITYARAYDPYGVVTVTSGSSQTSYAYTGEYFGDYSEWTNRLPKQICAGF